MKTIKNSRYLCLLPIFFIGLLFTIQLAANFEPAKYLNVSSSRLSGILNRAELWWYDVKMNLREIREFSPVTVAAIDDASLERFGRWPWSRGVIAEIVESLFDAGAKTVSFDVVFSEPEYKSKELQKTLEVLVPGRNQSIKQILKLNSKQVEELSKLLPEIGDQYFGQTVWRHGDKLVLGYFWKSQDECYPPSDQGLSFDQGNMPGAVSAEALSSQIDLIIKHGFRVSTHKDFVNHDFKKQGVGPLQLCPTINRGAVGSLAQKQGYFNALSDSDGLFRRSQLLLPFVKNSGENEGLYLFPSLSLSAAMAHLGAEAIGVEWLSYPDLTLKNINPISSQKQWVLPVEENGSVLIDFSKRTKGSDLVPTISLSRVGSWDEDEVSKIAGKSVFIGSTSTGVYDLRPNPVDAHSPGVYLHALAAAQILEIAESQNGYQGLTKLSLNMHLIYLWGFLGLLALSILFSRRAFVATLWWPVVIAVGLVDILIFQKDIVLNYMTISICWMLVLSTITLILYFLEERDRMFIKKAFARYVSPEVVRQIEEDPKSLNLFGQKKEITVLFADIKGFTAASESMSPDELRGMLSDYFGPMTEIIQAEGGTVDKFIGDALMALFGAPLSLVNHSESAISAAIKMSEAIKALGKNNQKFANFDLSIGIGVATGEASVGNMGTDKIFNYTALGDVVNLSSRLEGLSKIYGVPLVLSHACFEKLSPKYKDQMRLIDHVRVVGRHQSEKIYDHCSSVELKTAYKAAFELYQSGRWQEARESFLKISSLDKASAFMARRCELARDSVIVSDWDGVWNFDHK